METHYQLFRTPSLRQKRLDRPDRAVFYICFWGNRKWLSCDSQILMEICADDPHGRGWVGETGFLFYRENFDRYCGVLAGSLLPSYCNQTYYTTN